MTIEQILKLDEIKFTDQLTWRKESYDAGHPDCKCSACGEHINDDEDDQDDGLADPCPVRLWKGEGMNMNEAVLHTECFQYLHGKIFK